MEVVPSHSSLVDVLPEEQWCPRRGESPFGRKDGPFPGPDRWEKFKCNGDRVCSYCGSLHPDDMFRLVKMSAQASEDANYGAVVEIEPSDKNYKVYVNQPGVRNASEGGIKFYMMHLPRNADGTLAVTDEQQKEYGLAVKRSSARFAKYLYSNRQPAGAK